MARQRRHDRRLLQEPYRIVIVAPGLLERPAGLLDEGSRTILDLLLFFRQFEIHRGLALNHDFPGLALRRGGASRYGIDVQCGWLNSSGQGQQSAIRLTIRHSHDGLPRKASTRKSTMTRTFALTWRRLGQTASMSISGVRYSDNRSISMP